MAAKRTIIDKKKLYQLIKEGKSAPEIMKELKINLKQSLKSALHDLMLERNEILKVPGMEKRIIRNRKITKMGVNIPLAQLKDCFELGDEFKMEITKNKITLTKVKGKK